MPARLNDPSLLTRTAAAHSFLAVLALLCAAGCGRGAARGEAGASRPEAGRPLSTLIDGIGRTVTFPERPGSIISLAPSVTETLFLLGAGERVAGVTSHCDWPAEARSKPKVGTLLEPNIEVILGARPDVVIASTAGNDRRAVLRLAELGVPVFVTAPRSVDRIFETARQIAAVAGEEERGEKLVADMKARIARIRNRVAHRAPVTALFITWFEPLLAPGRPTFETDVLRLAGIESISADSEDFYPRYSLEQVLRKDPEVIVTVRNMGAPLPDLGRLAGWKELRAVRGGRVYVVDEAFQHPSPRFVDGLEELARLVYGEERP